MSKIIPLTQGKVTVVDDADYDRLRQWKWYAAESRKGSGAFYAQHCRRINGRNYTVQMQRMVMFPNLDITLPAIGLVDHKDHNTLDNRRANLRQTDNTGSARNRRCPRGKTCNYKGVTYRGPRPHRKEWRARITAGGKTVSLGDFPTAEDAARAHDQAAIRLHGEFACLNFNEMPAR